jgi:hypothetical protein
MTLSLEAGSLFSATGLTSVFYAAQRCRQGIFIRQYHDIAALMQDA